MVEKLELRVRPWVPKLVFTDMMTFPLHAVLIWPVELWQQAQSEISTLQLP